MSISTWENPGEVTLLCNRCGMILHVDTCYPDEAYLEINKFRSNHDEGREDHRLKRKE